jgi:hypothetical protein
VRKDSGPFPARLGILLWACLHGTEGRRKLLPHERKLLTDQQLRDASIDQIEDLVHRLNLVLQERGVPGLVWQRAPEDRVGEGHPARSDPFDPPTI